MRSNTLALVLLIAVGALLGQEPRPSQRNPFEAVPKAPESVSRKVSGPPIEAIEFRGTRRLSPSILRALTVSRVGGVYDVETLRRDTEALYKTGRFSDIVSETEPGPAGAIVRFVVVERPLIRSLEYQGDGTLTITEILERF